MTRQESQDPRPATLQALPQSDLNLPDIAEQVLDSALRCALSPSALPIADQERALKSPQVELRWPVSNQLLRHSEAGRHF
jgi:hypothetical protein